MIAEQSVWEHRSFRKEEIYEVARERSKAFEQYDILYFDCPAEEYSAEITQEIQAMWAGLLANKAVVNGYSGRWPTGYPEGSPPSDRELLDFVRPGPNVRFGRVQLTPEGWQVRPLSNGGIDR
jgi:hypothetical protein